MTISIESYPLEVYMFLVVKGNVNQTGKTLKRVTLGLMSHLHKVGSYFTVSVSLLSRRRPLRRQFLKCLDHTSTGVSM